MYQVPRHSELSQWRFSRSAGLLRLRRHGQWCLALLALTGPLSGDWSLLVALPAIGLFRRAVTSLDPAGLQLTCYSAQWRIHHARVPEGLVRSDPSPGEPCSISPRGALRSLLWLEIHTQGKRWSKIILADTLSTAEWRDLRRELRLQAQAQDKQRH